MQRNAMHGFYTYLYAWFTSLVLARVSVWFTNVCEFGSLSLSLSFGLSVCLWGIYFCRISSAFLCVSVGGVLCPAFVKVCLSVCVSSGTFLSSTCVRCGAPLVRTSMCVPSQPLRAVVLSPLSVAF